MQSNLRHSDLGLDHFDHLGLICWLSVHFNTSGCAHHRFSVIVRRTHLSKVMLVVLHFEAGLPISALLLRLLLSDLRYRKCRYGLARDSLTSESKLALQILNSEDHFMSRMRVSSIKLLHYFEQRRHTQQICMQRLHSLNCFSHFLPKLFNGEIITRRKLSMTISTDIIKTNIARQGYLFS